MQIWHWVSFVFLVALIAGTGSPRGCRVKQRSTKRPRPMTQPKGQRPGGEDA